MTRTLPVVLTLCMALLAMATPRSTAEPLRIGYSDWPGWVAWEIGIQKGWFEEAGVDVDFLWFDYVASMDAYVANQIDAVCMTNGDMLVTGGSGKPSVAILINDFSNGNDMLVARAGVTEVADLKGKRIGAELGFVAHLLALTALESHGLSADDVTFVDTPTDETPSVLASGDVDAIAAWQPNSGEALKAAPGAAAIFTSADAPGLIYDLLCVDPASLEARRDDWLKVVGVWYRITDYLADEDNLDDALEILAGRVSVSPDEYEPFFQGTHILGRDAVIARWADDADTDDARLDTLRGSSAYNNAFNVEQGAYDRALDLDAYLDPSVTHEVLAAD